MKKNSLYLALLLSAIISLQTALAADINGKVLYQGDINKPIGNVLVTLKNLSDNTVKTYITANDGTYQFTDLASGNYVVTGTTTNEGGGVTYYDATLVFLNIMGY